MTAAVALAMRHVHEQTGDGPLYIVGYSNGGALAVHYALSTLEDSGLPALGGIVLISPEIGVTSMAGLAIWQERIGRVLGLEKLAWNDVVTEYDPFKYASFPVNAGNLAHELTGVNRSKISRLGAAKKLQTFPRCWLFNRPLTRRYWHLHWCGISLSGYRRIVTSWWSSILTGESKSSHC